MEQMVDTKNGSFFVDISGPADARTVVLVAGLGDDHESWTDVVAALSSAYRCITLDNRGIGRSPVTAGPYTTEQLADDVHEVVSTLGIEKVTAIGSSMGGAICQQWALHHPDEVECLVLSNTWAERDRWLAGLLDYWIELARRGAGRDILSQLGFFCFSPAFVDANPDAFRELVESPVPNLAGFASCAQACRAHHMVDRLHQLDMPTLVIGGSADILTRPSFSEHLSRELPHAELVMIPAAHMIFWEQPDAWVSAVREFLDREP